ncbi:hypothetical protein [Enterococcus sp. UD-01]|jgi:hypothetical protein|uniref:hypothetical protein n=1 Tax=Enterococcus sp. UD-01 TaxID=3373911 RepID=UPI0038330011
MYLLLLMLTLVLFIHSLLLAFIIRKNSQLTNEVGHLRKDIKRLTAQKRLSVEQRSAKKRKNKATRGSKNT